MALMSVFLFRWLIPSTASSMLLRPFPQASQHRPDLLVHVLLRLGVVDHRIEDHKPDVFFGLLNLPFQQFQVLLDLENLIAALDLHGQQFFRIAVGGKEARQNGVRSIFFFRQQNHRTLTPVLLPVRPVLADGQPCGDVQRRHALPMPRFAIEHGHTAVFHSSSSEPYTCAPFTTRSILVTSQVTVPRGRGYLFGRQSSTRSWV